MTYEHTQSGPYLAAVLLFLAMAMTVVAIVVGEISLLATPAALVVVAAITHAFSSLTTTVTTDAVTVAFRWGRPSRTIPVDRIVSVEAVRNKWWYGWGIRWIPAGTMYNVWGLDGVHLELAGERDFRIGTDDPQVLAMAIEGVVGSRRP